MAEPRIRFSKEDGTDYPPLCNATMGCFYTERNERGGEGLPVLTVSIHSGVSDGELDEDELGKRVKRSADLTLYKRAEAGDLVFNMMRAWQGAVGSVKTTGMVSPAYIVAKPNSDLDPSFMDYYVQTDSIIKRFNRLSYGALDFRKRLYWDSFITTEVNVPILEEQQKIADFLLSIDEIISASEIEVQNLETQKKAMMKRIFSQEIRFKRNDGTEFPAWEKSTIDDTCDCLDNLRKPITKSDRESGPYPYYGSTSIQDYVAGYLFDEPLVLLAEDAGPFMDFWEKPIAQWAEGKFWVNNHAHVLRPSGNRKFMFYQLQHKDIREFINNPGRGKLNQEDMRKIVVGIPCLEEQRLIADFLSGFDEAIAAAKKELELWKELKKGLLQQMFV